MRFFGLHARILRKTPGQSAKAGRAAAPHGEDLREEGGGPSPAAPSCLCPGREQRLLLLTMMILFLVSVRGRSAGHGWEREWESFGEKNLSCPLHFLS